MTPFTDEDLKRLKWALESYAPNWVDRDNLAGLIARLEAAEWAIAATVGEFEDSPSVQAWRKAAGKDVQCK